MQVFYKKIKAKPQTTSPYQSALEKLTHLDVLKVKSMVADLLWIDWGAPILAVSGNH